MDEVMEYYSVFDEVLAMDVTAGAQLPLLLTAVVMILGVAAITVLVGQVSQLVERPQAHVLDLGGRDASTKGDRAAA